VNTGLTYQNVEDLATSAKGYVFAATWDGVFRSNDLGFNWTLMDQGPAKVVALATSASGYVFAGTYGGGVYLSTSGGNDWSAVNTGLTNGNVYALAVNVDGHLFAGTYGGGVLCSAQPTD
jgi:ligand-binding sensor domain-containing protein